MKIGEKQMEGEEFSVLRECNSQIPFWGSSIL